MDEYTNQNTNQNNADAFTPQAEPTPNLGSNEPDFTGQQAQGIGQDFTQQTVPLQVDIQPAFEQPHPSSQSSQGFTQSTQNFGQPDFTGQSQNLGEPAFTQQSQAFTQPRFDPQTGQPIPASIPTEPAKKKSHTIIGLIAVIAVVAIIGVVAFSMMGSSPYAKIYKAAQNTFKADPFISDLQKVFTLSDKTKGRATAVITLGSGDEAMSLTLESGVDISAKQQDMLLAFGSSYGVYDIHEYLTEDSAYVDSVLLNQPIRYNYVQGPAAGSALSDDSSEIDKVIRAYASLFFESDSEALQKEAISASQTFLQNLTYEALAQKEYEIDGKTVKCDGYEVVISTSEIVSLVRELQDIQNKYQGEFLGAMDELSDGASSTSYDYLINAIYQIDGPIIYRYYIYKNQFAAIEIFTSERDSAEILLHGGTYPWQNMEIIANDTTIALQGDTSGDATHLALVVDGVQMLSLEYDSSTKQFTIDSDMYYESIVGSIEHATSGGKFVMGSSDFELAITIDEEAGITLPSGDMFDLNTATEDDLITVINQDELEDLSTLAQILMYTFMYY